MSRKRALVITKSSCRSRIESQSRLRPLCRDGTRCALPTFSRASSCGTAFRLGRLQGMSLLRAAQPGKPGVQYGNGLGGTFPR
jgi:hypothetical protein